MTAMPAATRRKAYGSPSPRLSPPQPARSAVADFEKTARGLGISLFPWQKTAGRYLYALGPRDQWLWPEVAVIVARQQGKTSLLLPHIVHRMTMGRRVLHAANHRDLPRMSVFLKLCAILPDRFQGTVIRRAAGSESIELPNGGATGSRGLDRAGTSRLVDGRPHRGRGPRDRRRTSSRPRPRRSSASMKPQMLWLSNAGSDESTALNAHPPPRHGVGPGSSPTSNGAPPSELAADDPAGWLQANPAIGHLPGMLSSLEQAYRSHKMSGTLASFETERLCRWVATMRERLVDDYSWVRCKGATGAPVRPTLAVSVDPKGRRASVAMAWQQDGNVALRLLLNVTGDPVDTDAPRPGGQAAGTGPRCARSWASTRSPTRKSSSTSRLASRSAAASGPTPRPSSPTSSTAASSAGPTATQSPTT